MNREIKFRAWDKEENKMINNVVPFFNSDGTLECLVFGYSFGGYEFIEVELDKYQHIFTDPEFDKRYVLMQFTGLEDKNGIEIYEGDIVECFNDGLSEVLFRKGSFGTLTYTSRGIDFYTFNEVYGACEIIGNIYENPELLEVEV